MPVSVYLFLFQRGEASERDVESIFFTSMHYALGVSPPLLFLLVLVGDEAFEAQHVFDTGSGVRRCTVTMTSGVMTTFMAIFSNTSTIIKYAAENIVKAKME